ncbi:MAG: PQQ-binding-like beta-propeller repeat protein, partial [Candidatus Dormibacteraeota bacterium]|nr:PQQ-binding-like beta-propeller repeat protein [Candidatus Dormibacteraeota bacterium]
MNSRLVRVSKATPRKRVWLHVLGVASMLTGILTISGTMVLARTSGPPVNVSAAPAGSQDWPTYLHDTARSSSSGETLLNTTNVPYLAPKWTYTTGGIIAAEPTVVNGVAYLGSWDGYEYAFNAATGAVLWKTSLGLHDDTQCIPPDMGITSSATVYTNAAINGGKPVVYVGGANDSNNVEQWYALDAATGNILWSVPTGSGTPSGGDYNWSSPLIVTDPADGNPYAYVGVASVCDNPLIQGELLKVSLSTHQVVGTTYLVPNGQVGGGIWTSPTYDPSTNKIFVATGTLNLYSQTLSQAVVAINATSMAVVDHWQLPFEAAVSDSDFGTTPTLTTDANNDQLLSVANKNGLLYTLNRNNLSAGPIWQKQIAYGGDCPTCGDGSISSGAFANGTLYYAGGSVSDSNGIGHSGSVTALNPGTGAVLWTHYLNSPPLGSIVYDNGMIFLGNGSVEEALNASNGQDIWDYQLGAGTYAAPSVSEGTVFQGALNGTLYAFQPPSPLPGGPPADPNCPSGFTCQDLGTTGGGRPAGSDSVSNGVVSVTGSANWRNNGDNMRFVSEPVTGDFQVTVKDLSETLGPQNCNSLPKGDNSCYSQPQMGIVIRQSFQSGSPFYAALQDPNYPAENEPNPTIIIYYRTAWGSTAQSIIELTQHYPLNFPTYVMVQRHFDTFATFYSSDDQHWTLISGTIHTIVMPTTLNVGMGVASFMQTASSTATYSNFAVAAPTATYVEQAEPHACPSPWTCTDVGAGSPIGDQTLASGVWTVFSGGEGINNVTDGLGNNRIADAFHFIYQPLSSSGEITAQLASLTNGAAADQAALLMRADTSDGSPFYGVIVNPNGTATLEWRLYNG